MTRGLQNVLLVVVFAAIVAGLTFARQWLSSPPTTTTSAPVSEGDTQEAPIQFGGTTVAGGFNYEMSPARGYIDLWFENIKDEPLELGLEQTSCKCAGVKVRLISDDQSKKLLDWLPLAGATQVGLGVDGLLAVLGPASYSLSQMRDTLYDESKWEQMKRQDIDPTPFPLPGRSKGLIRLEWEGRKAGPERIGARVWVQPADKPNKRWTTNLEMPLVFVTPVMVSPVTATLDLGPGDRKTANFYCWSSTRAGFQLTARDESVHPCVTCTLIPLVGKEYEQVMQKLKGQSAPTILFGYRVAVELAERLDNGVQMELGEFNRRIILSSDQEFSPGLHDSTLSVRGRVQGEVSVGLGNEYGRVNLGVYPVARGTNVVVPLETLKPGLKLKKVEQTPSYLEVELTQTGTGLGGIRYKMKVVVPPNRGSLPEDSAIVLETIDSPPRKVRIPVVGTASIPIR
jgi:hypothetical protein